MYIGTPYYYALPSIHELQCQMFNDFYVELISPIIYTTYLDPLSISVCYSIKSIPKTKTVACTINLEKTVQHH